MKKMILALLAALALAVVPATAASATYDEEVCVPRDAWTETVEHPAQTHTETIEVVVTEAWTETVVVTEAHWQRYSWTGGPWTSPYAPEFPGEGWQPNVQGDPHGVGVEGGYFRSHGNSGNGDWFYLEWVDAVTETIEHPAVTETQTITVIDKEAWTETIEHPAVVCEEEPPAQPDPLVETSIEYWVDCDLQVTRTEYVATTPYVLVDGEWVLGVTAETSSTVTEQMTIEEIDAITDGPVIFAVCEEPEEPVTPEEPEEPITPVTPEEPPVTPEKEETPVKPVTQTAKVAQTATPMLAETGPSTAMGASLVAALLALAGTALMLLHRRLAAR